MNKTTQAGSGYSSWYQRVVALRGFYLVVLILIVLDQASKHWVVQAFFEYERLNVLPFFDLTLIYNDGAAFSFLSGAGGWQRWLLSGVSLAVSLVIGLSWLPAQTRTCSLWAMTLILAGAIGNLIDRLFLGKVIDFISLYYGGYFFPSFNVADSAITIGAIFLFIDWLILEPLDEKRALANQENQNPKPGQ